MLPDGTHVVNGPARGPDALLARRHRPRPTAVTRSPGQMVRDQPARLQYGQHAACAKLLGATGYDQSRAATEQGQVMTHVEREIASQPDCWRRAVDLAADAQGLPARGERVAVAGCGTSWFMAQAYAALRERSGQGETDAFAASELPTDRRYDRVVVLSRSGTTSEVLQLVTALPAAVATTAITGDASSPLATLERSGHFVITLDFADERSVVQTRFATSALALLRVHLGDDLTVALADVQRALDEPLTPEVVEAGQHTFLGTGWAYGIAQEAALKMREAANAWTEAYPAMEYRHGPIAITGPDRVAWMFGAAPAELAADVAATGGIWVDDPLDPMADLVRAQRLAVACSTRKGLDPDRPRHLTRSVVLDG